MIFDTLGHDYGDGVIFYDLAELKRFWAKVYRQNFRLIYRPLDPVSEFEEVCELVYKCGDLYFVAEELDLFAAPQKLSTQFRQIVTRGRHEDIHFIGVTQRPFGIDRIFTAMASEVYVFKTDEPRDRQYLSERLGSEIVGKLDGLQEYEYVHWADHGKELTTGRDEYCQSVSS